jgi:RND family efflux transporter MFP subunit
MFQRQNPWGSPEGLSPATRRPLCALLLEPQPFRLPCVQSRTPVPTARTIQLMSSRLSPVHRPAAAFAAVALLASVGCGRHESADLSGMDATAVTTEAARVTAMRESVSAAGSIVPMAAADFVVTASEPCAIAELPKQEGDTVQAGDVVARFDIPAVAAELANRALEVSQAAARQATAKAEADRLAGLVEKGVAPRNQLELARSALAVADGNLTQAQGRLDAAKAAEAATIIHARFDGVIVKRWHNPGDLVTGLETDPILRIVDPGRLQVATQVPADQGNRVLPGQTADIETGMGPAEAAVVGLKLVPASPTEPVDVRLNFLVPTTLPLDTPVQVSILINERRNALVVPADAVQRIEGRTFVWMADENSLAVRRDVRVGFISNGAAEIVSGLTAGERVIVTGIAQLTDGVPVSVTR